MSPRFVHIRLARGSCIAEGESQVCIEHRAGNTELDPDDRIFAGWRWDGQRLVVETGLHGVVPLYFYRSASEICISTCLLTVLDRTRAFELDDAALAVFLRIGFFLGDDTPFSGIKAVPNDMTLTWHEGAVQLHKRPRLVNVDSTLSRIQALDAYIDLFRASMTKRLAIGEFVLPLSGGRDSRHILLELCRAKRKPLFCVTAELPPPRTNEDVRVAKVLCDRFDVPHRTVHQDGDFVAAAREKNRLTGFCSDEHTWAIPLVRHIAGHVGYVFDGIGGDVLSAGLFSSPQRLRYCRQRDLGALAADIIGENETSLSRTLTPAFHRRFAYDLANDRLRQELARHADAPNPIASFYFWNRTRREIALLSYGMFPDGVTVLSPYLDVTLFGFLMSIPGEMLVDGKFHTDAIARAFPLSADIPYGRPEGDERAARFGRLHTRWIFAKLAWGVLRYLGSHDGESMVDQRFVLPRIAYYLLDGDGRRIWFDLEKIIHLTQLERYIRETSRRSDASFVSPLPGLAQSA